MISQPHDARSKPHLAHLTSNAQRFSRVDLRSFGVRASHPQPQTRMADTCFCDRMREEPSQIVSSFRNPASLPLAACLAKPSPVWRSIATRRWRVACQLTTMATGPLKRVAQQQPGVACNRLLLLRSPDRTRKEGILRLEKLICANVAKNFVCDAHEISPYLKSYRCRTGAQNR